MEPDEKGDPATRYLDDAWAVARDEGIDQQLRTTVVCTLVREAIESTCHELIRAAHARQGVRHAESEELIGAAQGLKPTLGLALLGEARRASDLRGTLAQFGAAAWQVVNDANRGVHPGDVRTPLVTLVREAQRMIERMRCP